jgi:hypothetical protein
MVVLVDGNCEWGWVELQRGKFWTFSGILKPLRGLKSFLKALEASQEFCKFVKTFDILSGALTANQKLWKFVKTVKSLSRALNTFHKLFSSTTHHSQGMHSLTKSSNSISTQKTTGKLKLHF